MTRRFFIKKETHEFNVLTRPRLSGKKFCEGCRQESSWLFPEEAMLLAQISLREIFRLVELREIHFVENPEGFLLVCAKSLASKKTEK